MPIDVVDLQTTLESDNRLKIAFLMRIMSDTGLMGLVRLFSADQDTVHLLLTEGVRVASHTYRIEESRTTAHHIPLPPVSPVWPYFQPPPPHSASTVPKLPLPPI